jgi:hypothetical protein
MADSTQSPATQAAALIAQALALLVPASNVGKWVKVDAHVPGGRHAVLGAIRRGELTGYRPGKCLVVKADELDKWIEAHRVEPTPITELDPVAAALAAAGVRRIS